MRDYMTGEWIDDAELTEDSPYLATNRAGVWG